MQPRSIATRRGRACAGSGAESAGGVIRPALRAASSTGRLRLLDLDDRSALRTPRPRWCDAPQPALGVAIVPRSMLALAPDCTTLPVPGMDVFAHRHRRQADAMFWTLISLRDADALISLRSGGWLQSEPGRATLASKWRV